VESVVFVRQGLAEESFDVARVDSGHAAPESFAVSRELDEDLSAVGLAMVSVDQAGVDESSDDAIAGAVGDEQPLGEVAHADRVAIGVELVEDVVVVEGTTEFGTEVAVHRCDRCSVEADEAFPGVDDGRIGHCLILDVSDRK